MLLSPSCKIKIIKFLIHLLKAIMHPHIRLINYVATHSLIPRKKSWASIQNTFGFNLSVGKQIWNELGKWGNLSHDVEPNERYLWLPYGDLVTKILEHTDFNLEEEEYISNSAMIGKHGLGHTWMSIIDEVVVQKPSKARKYVQSQHAPEKPSPLNLDKLW